MSFGLSKNYLLLKICPLKLKRALTTLEAQPKDLEWIDKLQVCSTT
jgi:hypothetical protein